jgi:hypothetical protein
MRRGALLLSCVLAVTPALSADFLQDPVEVEALLKGATLEGVYLRSQAAYRLEFKSDGRLVGSDGEGRWWVNEQGQYCREWLSGRLQGNQACLDLTCEGDGLGIYSQGRKVAEGRLLRE